MIQTWQIWICAIQLNIVFLKVTYTINISFMTKRTISCEHPSTILHKHRTLEQHDETFSMVIKNRTQDASKNIDQKVNKNRYTCE